jgi:hypothetical protein
MLNIMILMENLLVYARLVDLLLKYQPAGSLFIL